MTEKRLEELLWARGSTPETRLQRKEDLILLADILAILPTDYQRVLCLRNLEELSFKEVAKQMDRSVGATRMLWGRAIECLQPAYAESLSG